MRIFGGLLVVAAAVALTACSGPGMDTAPSPQAVDPVSVATQGPLIGATPPAPKKAATASVMADDGLDALYLKNAKYRWVGDLPTDEQLITAGKLACTQMHAGATLTEVNIGLHSGAAEDQSVAIATASQSSYCPDTIQAVK